eukprot:UN03303
MLQLADQQSITQNITQHQQQLNELHAAHHCLYTAQSTRIHELGAVNVNTNNNNNANNNVNNNKNNNSDMHDNYTTISHPHCDSHLSNDINNSTNSSDPMSITTHLFNNQQTHNNNTKQYNTIT